MNRFYAAASAVEGCIVRCSVSPTDVLAQTGGAATRQLQDTQRTAQERAREAKSNTRDRMNKNNETQPAPASGAQ
jgi:hypothetical protein